MITNNENVDKKKEEYIASLENELKVEKNPVCEYVKSANHEKFKLIELDDTNSKYNYILIYLDTEDLYYSQKYLKRLLTTGKTANKRILLDLFYRNGNSFNRYFEVALHYGELRFLPVAQAWITQEERMVSQKFFKSNKDLLTNSALPSLTILQYLNGEII